MGSYSRHQMQSEQHTLGMAAFSLVDKCLGSGKPCAMAKRRDFPGASGLGLGENLCIMNHHDARGGSHLPPSISLDIS